MQLLPGTPLGATALSFAHNGTLLAVAVGGTMLWGVQVSAAREVAFRADFCKSCGSKFVLRLPLARWTAQVWDVITGALMITMTGHYEMVSSFAFGKWQL
jgi:hypothetical protein